MIKNIIIGFGVLLVSINIVALFYASYSINRYEQRLKDLEMDVTVGFETIENYLIP